MIHDEMCPRKTWEADPYMGEHCAVCELIGRVREEWYEVQSETWQQGYEYALKEAREAVADVRTWPTPLPHPAPSGFHAVIIKDDALAAIDALKEERS